MGALARDVLLDLLRSRWDRRYQRPSDSIAVTLRVDAQIFAQDDLLEVASIEVAEDEAADIPGQSPPTHKVTEDPESMDSEALKEHLRKLNPEDFGRFTP